MTKNDIARSYRDKYGMEMPTLKLARIMYEDHNLTFSTVEDARMAIRRIEGKSGRETSTKTHKCEERPRNPYNLPISDEKEYKPYIIDGKRVLILSDIHIPYHSIRALTATFDWAKKRNPDTIVLNGDTLDAHQLSRFVRDPKKRSFADELAAFEEFYGALRSTFPKANVVYKIGNHEERYDHFLMMKAHELTGVDEFRLSSVLERRAPGAVMVGDKRIMRAGGLNIVHGHEFGGNVFNPVNVARGLFLRAKVSCIQGHNHQTSEHTETDMNGRITTTWSTGCLSDLRPEYLPINKWNHGFAWVEVDGEDFEVQNKRIYKGEVL